MTFPAELAFKRDRTLTATTRRVYDYLTTTLDFTEVRLVKNDLLADSLGMNAKYFRAALNALVSGGYLIEHARGPRGARQFTLAWSLNPDRRQQAG